MKDKELAYFYLKQLKPAITKQCYRTIEGQIKAGDYTGAIRGMERIMRKGSK